MSMSNSESRKREADKAAVPSGLASELRERIMDYGNHLTAVQAMDAARAILASDWLAEHVAAAKAESQATITDLRDAYRSAIGVPESDHQRERMERMATELEAALGSLAAERAERADTCRRCGEPVYCGNCGLADNQTPAPECADCHRSPDEHEPNDHPHVPVGDQGDRPCTVCGVRSADIDGTWVHADDKVYDHPAQPSQTEGER